MKRITGAVLIAALLSFTAACGGGGDRPSQAEVSKSLTADDSVLGSIPEKQADCLAKLLVESDLSDKALNAMVEQDNDYKASKNDTETLTEVGTKLATECAA